MLQTPQSEVLNEIENYIYDGENVIFDFVDPDGVGSSPMVLKHRYLYGPAVDQILAQEDATVTLTSPNRVLWFLGDDQNTTHDLIDNTGTAVTGGHYEYGSFGNVTNVAADLSLTRYFYTGRELDTATGEQYNRERWYDSSTGRWLSEDPIGFAGRDTNLYRYVGNGPTNATDPSGLIVIGTIGKDGKLEPWTPPPKPSWWPDWFPDWDGLNDPGNLDPSDFGLLSRIRG